MAIRSFFEKKYFAIQKRGPLIYDNYTAHRGSPQMYNIFCSSCNHFLIQYQKDGPGILKRCYVDRIHRPSSIRKKMPVLIFCSSCKAVIASHIIYNPSHNPENRPAYKMTENSFKMKEI